MEHCQPAIQISGVFFRLQMLSNLGNELQLKQLFNFFLSFQPFLKKIKWSTGWFSALIPLKDLDFFAFFLLVVAVLILY